MDKEVSALVHLASASIIHEEEDLLRFIRHTPIFKSGAPVAFWRLYWKGERVEPAWNPFTLMVRNHILGKGLTRIPLAFARDGPFTLAKDLIIVRRVAEHELGLPVNFIHQLHERSQCFFYFGPFEAIPWTAPAAPKYTKVQIDAALDVFDSCVRIGADAAPSYIS